MVTLWIKPDNRDHQITIMLHTETPDEAFCWNRAMELATKQWQGFNQIHQPTACNNFGQCDEHFRCPGLDGWELLFQHPTNETVLNIIAEAFSKATELLKQW